MILKEISIIYINASNKHIYHIDSQKISSSYFTKSGTSTEDKYYVNSWKLEY